MPKHHLIVLLAAGIFFIVCASLVRSILLSQQAHKALEEQQREVQQLEDEVRKLEETVQEATSSFELERRVREELNQQKSGEQILELRRR